MAQVKLKSHTAKKEQTLKCKEFALHRCRGHCKYRKAMRINKIIYLSGADLIFPVCPQCGGAIEREYMKHCSSCGQKLSWIGFKRVKITYR